MKISGKKNDGAWYRTNKRLKTLTASAKATLASLIIQGDYADNAFQAIRDLMIQSGVADDAFPSGVSEWVTNLVNTGIPRQVWYGKLSWTTYSPDSAHPGRYIANYQSQMHYFAKDLRKKVRDFLLGMRQAADLGNQVPRAEGNPGGVADATADN